MARHQSSDTPTFIKKAKNLHGGRYDYINTVYVSRGKKVEIICPKHGSFFQTPKEHLRGQGCPYCTESSGERKIAEWLKSHSIEFISQYHIKPQQKCLFGRNYFRVDFYIPHKKIIIEYNGKQHYELVPHFHTIAEFQDQQDRDKRLRIYCKQNKITLIEIPYTADKRINNILNKHIL